jgi:hypothetical protein
MSHDVERVDLTVDDDDDMSQFFTEEELDNARKAEASYAISDRNREIWEQNEAYMISLATDQAKDAAAQATLTAERARETRERESQEIRVLKRNSLPAEPPPSKSSVELTVRMPDGSRWGRRFSITDSLQTLFDYVDVSSGVEPGSYRLVIPTFEIGCPAVTYDDNGNGNEQRTLEDAKLTVRTLLLFSGRS